MQLYHICDSLCVYHFTIPNYCYINVHFIGDMQNAEDPRLSGHTRNDPDERERNPLIPFSTVMIGPFLEPTLLGGEENLHLHLILGTCSTERC